MLVGEERKLKVVCELCNYLGLKSRLDQCVPVKHSTRKRAARNLLFRTLKYATFLNQSSVVSKTALLRKKEQIKIAWKALVRKIRGADEYDVSWCRTCGYLKWLRASGLIWRKVGSEWQHWQKRFDNDRDGKDEHPELFRNEIAMPVDGEVSGFSVKRCGDAGRIKWSIVCSARVGVWVAAVGRCSTERETHEGQEQKLYANTQGNLLELAMEQLNGNVRVFLNHRAGDEARSGRGVEMKHLVEVSASTEGHMCVDRKNSENKSAME